MKRFIAALLCVGAARVGAQMRAEARIDAVRTTRVGAEAGIGLFAPLGTYLRSGVLVGYDIVPDSAGDSRGRVEATVRFLLDPIAERPWGLSFAGGIGVRERPYLMVAADLEGPVVKGVRPAVQFALGGGLRLGVVLRAARPNRR